MYIKLKKYDLCFLESDRIFLRGTLPQPQVAEWKNSPTIDLS